MLYIFLETLQMTTLIAFKTHTVGKWRITPGLVCCIFFFLNKLYCFKTKKHRKIKQGWLYRHLKATYNK